MKSIIRSIIYEDKNSMNDIYIAKKQDLEEYCLKLSLAHKILSEVTAFICVIKEKAISEKEAKTTKKTIVPIIQSSDY